MAGDPIPRLPAGVDAFLREHRRTFLVTLRKDGYPTVHPMTGLYDEGTLRYTSYRLSAKNRNVERDPRVCCLAINGYDAARVKAVTLKGTAVVKPGAAMPKRGPAKDAEPTAATRAQRALQAGRRVIIEILPHTSVGFTDELQDR